MNQDFSLNGSRPIRQLRDRLSSFTAPEKEKQIPQASKAQSPLGIVPLPMPLYPVSVSFDGIVATNIPYAGETPTALAGLMQINVVIPTNVPSGPVSVLVTINGQTSPGNVTIYVQ